MNELYIQKLLRLIKNGVIAVEDIVDITYKTEIQNRFNTQ